MLDWHEAEELACYAMGLTSDQTEEALRTDTVGNLVEHRYGCSLEEFSMVAGDLLKLTPVVSAINGELFHAFIDIENKTTIVKEPFGKRATLN